MFLHRIPPPLNIERVSANPHSSTLCVVKGISQLKTRNNNPAPKTKLKIALIMTKFETPHRMPLINLCLCKKIVHNQFVAKKQTVPQKRLLGATAQKAGQRLKPGVVAHFAKAALISQGKRKSQGSFRCLDFFHYFAASMRCERSDCLPSPEEQGQHQEDEKNQDKPPVDEPKFSLFTARTDMPI